MKNLLSKTMPFFSTQLAYRGIYVGALAYSLTACAPNVYQHKNLQGISDDIKAQFVHYPLTKELDDVHIAIQPEGATQDMIGFQVEISNFSDKPIDIDLKKFYAIGYSAKLPEPVYVQAINPEQKIKEMDDRIVRFIRAKETERGILMFLGIVLIVGIIIIAVAASIESQNASTSSESSSNSTPSSNSSNKRNYALKNGNNNPTPCEKQSLVGTTLDLVGFVGKATITGYFRSMDTQQKNLEHLTQMRSMWENYALRPVMLQSQEKVRGTLFFPRKPLRVPRIRIELPVTPSGHSFLFGVPQ